MAHTSAKQPYLDLRERLDRYPIGAPEGKGIYDILKLLYTEDEARLAVQMPLTFISLSALSRRVGSDPAELRKRLDVMADKGLVMDIETDRGPCYVLAPTVVGFFEMSLMRVPSGVDARELANLYRMYFEEDTAFRERVFGGETQIGRTLVHEKSLHDDVLTEVLDHERATLIAGAANDIAVGICFCRHKMLHLGQECKFPLEVCMSFGSSADYLIRRGFSRRIDSAEALDILAQTRDLGLVHIADNVRNNVSFICQCCSCCCEFLRSANTLHIDCSVATSNFIATVEQENCIACGKCAGQCPVHALQLHDRKEQGAKLEINQDICLGCGLCVPVCPTQAMKMEPRSHRLITPKDTIERLLLQAIERGTLGHLIADPDDPLPMRVLAGAINGLLSLSPVRRMMASRQIKSRFVHRLLALRKSRNAAAALNALQERSGVRSSGEGAR